MRKFITRSSFVRLCMLLASCALFLFGTMAFAQTPFRFSASFGPQAIRAEAGSADPLRGDGFFKRSLGFYCKTLRPVRSPEPSIASPPKAWVGISIEAIAGDRLPLAGAADLFYVRVVRVVKGAPGYLAGIREGDVILKIDNVEVAFPEELLMDQFARLLEKAGIGDLARFEVLRNGKVETLEVRLLTPRPKLKLMSKQHPQLVCPAQAGPSVLQSELERQRLAEHFSQVSRYLGDGAEFVHYIDFNSGKKISPGRLGEVTFLLKNPLKTLPAAAIMAEKLAGGPFSERRDLARFFDAAFYYLDYAPGPSRHTGSSSVEKLFASDKGEPMTIDDFIEIIISSGELIKAAFSRLSPSELISLRAYLLKFLGDDFPAKGHGILSPEEFDNFAELSAKVDFSAVATAAKMVFSSLAGDKIDSLIKEARALESMSEAGGDRLLLYKDSPAGKIIVGGSGRNIYTEDAALIIELGGDDLYLNNAGAAIGGLPVSIVIDFAGDDTYIGKGAAGQGAGLMGIGALVDLGGNDSYYHLNSGQGLGAFGAGALVDLGGNDDYRAGRFAQGSGFFGAGLLYDSAGDDIYKVDAVGQGLGGPAGLGALIDSSGDDRYESGSKYRDFRDPKGSYDSMAQGFGFGLRPAGDFLDIAGGIGLLLDAAGDDTYLGDYFAQGSAYWYSIGALIDGAGDDSYISGRYAQGAGVHFAVGALLDYSGSDSYFASYGVAQGAGHDRAFGLLYDGAGDDGYFGGRMSQGLGSANGMGAMVDAKGVDIYSATSPGQGWGVKYQNRGSFGIMLDIGAEDDFFSGSAAASSSVERGAYGLFYDERRSQKR